MKSDHAIELSILVPCYNEQQAIMELYRRLHGLLKEKLPHVSYEIVLVNDGSSDDSWKIISELAREDERVTAINLSRNFGHQIALSATLNHCRGERAFIIDADLQDPPELLPAMMKKMDEGFDLVRGKRTARKGETWFKRSSASGFYRLFNMFSDTEIPLDTGEFRLINRKVIGALNAMPETNRFTRGLCSWAGFRQAELPYEREARFAGETHYTLRKMLALALDAITGFSVRPLRLTFYFGLILAFIGVLILIYILYHHMTHAGGVPGWASLAALIVILQSIQFMFLGMFGEYLAQIFIESKQRPLYFVAAIIRDGREEA